MRRIAILIFATLVAVAVQAQRAQDFASRFVRNYEGDTAVHCVTVSPTMMEQLAKKHYGNGDKRIVSAVEKLKSARIVTTYVNGEAYYQAAEDMLKRNATRFRHDKDYRNDNSHGTFYSRKLRSGATVELIMLHSDTQKHSMVIVNLTGDIDDEFINSLTTMIAPHTAKAGGNRTRNF